jgi:uncharacterized protein (DUF58 family)
VSPTVRSAWTLGALAVAALFLPVAFIALAIVALAVAMIVDALLVRQAPALRRTMQDVLARGVASPVSIELEETRHGHLFVRQPAPPDVAITPSVGREGLDASMVARRRGRHTIPGAATRSEGPLGLAAWHHRAIETEQIRVYPDLPRARRIAAAVRRGEFDVSGVRLRGPLGLGTDFESIRDYLPDDDIRQVNWRATARVGRPMSNQFRVDLDRDVICAVDCGRLMAAPLEDRTRLDAALDAAVAVAAVADVLDDRSGAIAFDSELQRRVDARRKGAGSVATALYDLEPSRRDSDYELAFRAVGTSKRAFVLVLTDLLEESAARPLLEAIPILARKHSVTVAGASDPDLDEIVRTQPAEAFDAYRAAVAVDVLTARQSVAAKLRAAGAQVVETAPHALSAACVSAYLRAKAGARL